MQKEKKIPKRIVCITQFDDNSLHFSFAGCLGRAEVKKLLDLCDREARRRLARAIPLDKALAGSPTVTGAEEKVNG